MKMKMAPRGFFGPDGKPVLTSIDLVNCADDDPEAIEERHVEAMVGSDPRRPDGNLDVVSQEVLERGIRAYMARPNPHDGAELERVETDGRITVIYVDVGDLPPGAVVNYVESVEKAIGMGKALPDPVLWIPQRGGVRGADVVSIKPEDVVAIYVDVGAMPPEVAKAYVRKTRERIPMLPDVPFIASRDGVADAELLDEKEMNERGWYYYGVKPDGTEV
jgi:hypothetical protein